MDTTLIISTIRISGSSHNVSIRLLLDCDHLGNKFGVVAEIGVHDNNEVASHVFQAVHVSGSQAKLALSGLEDNVFGAIELLKLLRDFEGAVRGSIIDNNDLPIELSVIQRLELALI